MKIARLLSLFFIGVLSTLQAKSPERIGDTKTLAAWTVVVYIQADNSLEPFAIYNINDMQTITLPSNVNLLVQWDQPHNNKTWRYRITKGGRIDVGSLSTEMGLKPEKELVDCMQWIKTSYPASRYALILWNHGSGIQDHRKANNKMDKDLSVSMPWLEIPGLSIQSIMNMRGILFDDSQHTYLNNQGLTSAMSKIKGILGKKLDLLGMDACLMSMIEVMYQVKDYATIMVGSQNVEPGEGWSYSGFLSAFSTNPTALTPEVLGAAIVQAYGNFYVRQETGFSQTAVSLSAIKAIGDNITTLIAAISTCKKANATQTTQAVRNAYQAAIKFDIPEYIDLYSFYQALATNISRRPNLNNMKPKPTPKPTNAFNTATANLQKIATAGMKLIQNAVLANQVGSDYLQAKGISIYYPTGSIDSSYPLTIFAQTTTWLSFIREYRM